ncbi:hypothetical protein SEA_SKOG_141 [Gordonia phage Skog]|uniref:Uncharacterized protein n=1 Tax=Gordonia phage Skog TaxID=2704033 RepID=A0A6G6XKJ7_9CAUD|nr:hypothetical protein KHQ85_gp141 [Gordonia phage Skog]QIG58293.1 hypothetical protein SEA_SKOG_141 [Gordonia phage Skog]
MTQGSSSNNRRRVCDTCQFRLDVPPYLTRDHVEAIAQQIEDGHPLECHELHDPRRITTRGCAGAIITSGRPGTNPVVPHPCYPNLKEWVEAH